MSLLAEHQIAAVEQLLDLLGRRGGALLADEVGLGKSHVAADVARHFIRRDVAVEMIIPASLVPQWQVTLARFGVVAAVFTHDGIVTMPFLANPAERRLVIVDEAHAFRNPHTKRYAALARRSVASYLLLVTATPFCNSLRDLEALIRLIACDDLLADRGVPSIDLAFVARDRGAMAVVLEELVIRRDRHVLPIALRFGELDRRVVRHPMIDVAAEIDALQFPLVGYTALLRRFLWRRLESSEAALLESLRRQVRFYDRVVESLAAGRVLSKRDYRVIFGHEEDAPALQQILFWEAFVPPSTAATIEEVREELARIGNLRVRVEGSPQTKRSLLEDVVSAASEPLLIFTSSAATARDLFVALRACCRCGLVTGSDRRNATAALDAFCAGRIDVLVSTDVGSEGLNLQRAATVIHYDIPWNPVKLDQRNGRALRIGQRRPRVSAIYFLPDNDSSGVVATVAAKNRVRKSLLGVAAVTAPSAATPTIRPRLTRDAAAVRFLHAAERLRLQLPKSLFRRHRAGVELLLNEMTGEYLDESRVADLLAILDAEPLP